MSMERRSQPSPTKVRLQWIVKRIIDKRLDTRQHVRWVGVQSSRNASRNLSNDGKRWVHATHF